jgi:transketolase
VQTALAEESIAARVVSAPCLEWFAQESPAYRESVLPKSARLKVSIEAGIAQGWREYIGDSGIAISLEHYGASASATKLFAEFGFGADVIVSKIESALK